MAAGYTGGTAAPGAPSAPRVPTPRPQGPPRPGKGGGGPGQRYYNKASGKMETAQAMRNYRAPGKTPVRPAAASRALGAPAGNAPAKAKSPYVGGEILNLPNQSRAEKQNIAGSINRILQANERTAAQPFQQKAGEIGNVEQTVAGRFANVNRGAVANAQGLLGNAEASAKTFENQAAENALSANRAVETAGQNAVTANAGQLPPELRGQLAFNEGQIRGIGAAGEQRANELGANAVAYQRALAAAAVQRGQEGQQNIVNTYGAQRGKNQAEQNRAIERERGKAKEQRITLPQELNKMRLAETLGQGKLAEGQQKLAQGAVKLGQKNVELGQKGAQVNINAQKAAAQARNYASEEGARISKEKGERFNESYRAATLAQKEVLDQLKVKELGPKIAEMIARANAENAKALGGGKPGTKPPTQQELQKLGEGLGSAFQSIRAMRDEGEPMREIPVALNRGYFKSGGKAHRIPPVKDSVLVKAAMELWNTHKVSPATRKLMGEKGMNIGTDQEAFERVNGGF